MLMLHLTSPDIWPERHLSGRQVGPSLLSIIIGELTIKVILPAGISWLGEWSSALQFLHDWNWISPPERLWLRPGAGRGLDWNAMNNSVVCSL